MDLAHLHPLFVHFPISLSLVGTGLLGWGLFGKKPGITRAGLIVLLLGGIFAVPTYVTGEVAREVLADSPEYARAEPMLDHHEDLGLTSLAAFTAVGVLAGIALAKGAAESEKEKPWGLFVLALATAIIVAVTAWYGGMLVFDKGVGVRAPPPPASTQRPK